MKAEWKNLFFWSSLGSLAVGATVALARRTKKNAETELVCKDIPPNCEKILVWTERFHIEHNGREEIAYDEYLFQATPFKVWSVFDIGTDRDSQSRRGGTIYHVTQCRRLDSKNDFTKAEHVLLHERFYGTIDVFSTKKERCGPNRIARGGVLEIKKCYVGGTSNGVETGEVHRSSAPILNFRFEYALQQSQA